MILGEVPLQEDTTSLSFSENNFSSSSSSDSEISIENQNIQVGTVMTPPITRDKHVHDKVVITSAHDLQLYAKERSDKVSSFQSIKSIASDQSSDRAVMIISHLKKYLRRDDFKFQQYVGKLSRYIRKQIANRFHILKLDGLEILIVGLKLYKHNYIINSKILSVIAILMGKGDCQKNTATEKNNELLIRATNTMLAVSTTCDHSTKTSEERGFIALLQAALKHWMSRKTIIIPIMSIITSLVENCCVHTSSMLKSLLNKLKRKKIIQIIFSIVDMHIAHPSIVLACINTVLCIIIYDTKNKFKTDIAFQKVVVIQGSIASSVRSPHKDTRRMDNENISTTKDDLTFSPHQNSLSVIEYLGNLLKVFPHNEHSVIHDAITDIILRLAAVSKRVANIVISTTNTIEAMKEKCNIHFNTNPVSLAYANKDGLKYSLSSIDIGDESSDTPMTSHRSGDEKQLDTGVATTTKQNRNKLIKSQLSNHNTDFKRNLNINFSEFTTKTVKNPGKYAPVLSAYKYIDSSSSAADYQQQIKELLSSCSPRQSRRIRSIFLKKTKTNYVRSRVTPSTCIDMYRMNNKKGEGQKKMRLQKTIQKKTMNSHLSNLTQAARKYVQASHISASHSDATVIKSYAGVTSSFLGPSSEAKHQSVPEVNKFMQEMAFALQTARSNLRQLSKDTITKHKKAKLGIRGQKKVALVGANRNVDNTGVISDLSIYNSNTSSRNRKNILSVATKDTVKKCYGGSTIGRDQLDTKNEKTNIIESDIAACKLTASTNRPSSTGGNASLLREAHSHGKQPIAPYTRRHVSDDDTQTQIKTTRKSNGSKNKLMTGSSKTKSKVKAKKKHKTKKNMIVAKHYPKRKMEQVPSSAINRGENDSDCNRTSTKLNELTRDILLGPKKQEAQCSSLSESASLSREINVEKMSFRDKLELLITCAGEIVGDDGDRDDNSEIKSEVISDIDNSKKVERSPHISIGRTDNTPSHVHKREENAATVIQKMYRNRI